ncbi:hypothetical protein ACFLY7_00150 [Patescibacteria group bacterium]
MYFLKKSKKIVGIFLTVALLVPSFLLNPIQIKAADLITNPHNIAVEIEDILKNPDKYMNPTETIKDSIVIDNYIDQLVNYSGHNLTREDIANGLVGGGVVALSCYLTGFAVSSKTSTGTAGIQSGIEEADSAEKNAKRTTSVPTASDGEARAKQDTVQHVDSKITAESQAIAAHSGTYKECILDGVANVAKQILLKKITASIVTWINSDFEGQPSFVTDSDFTRDAFDETIGSFILGGDLAFLCSPFSIDVKLALLFQQSSGDYIPKCTIQDITGNTDNAFAQLDEEWNWDTWRAMTTIDENNAYGAMLSASIRLNSKTTALTNKINNELNWSGGFRNIETCDTVYWHGLWERWVSEEDWIDYFDVEYGTEWTIENAKPGKKINCQTRTPGKIVSDIASNSVWSGIGQLEMADEFDEIIGALAGYLVRQILSEDGLLGASEKKEENNGKSTLDLILEDVKGANVTDPSYRAGDEDVDSESGIGRKVSEVISPQTKFELSSGIDEKIQHEDNYINIKNDSWVFVNQLITENEMEETEACYTGKINNSWWRNQFGFSEELTATDSLNKISELTILINENLGVDGDWTTTITNLETATSTATTLKTLAEETGIKIESINLEEDLTATEEERIKAIIQEYNSLLNTPTSELNDAYGERSVVSIKVPILLQQYEDELTECESYNLETEPTP